MLISKSKQTQKILTADIFTTENAKAPYNNIDYWIQ